MKKLFFVFILGTLSMGAWSQTSVTCGTKKVSIPGELVSHLKSGGTEFKTYAAIKSDSVMIFSLAYVDAKLSSITSYQMPIKTIDASACTIVSKETGYSSTPKAFWVTFNKPMFGGVSASVMAEEDGCSLGSSSRRVSKVGYATGYFDSEAKAKEFQQKVFARGMELTK